MGSKAILVCPKCGGPRIKRNRKGFECAPCERQRKREYLKTAQGKVAGNRATKRYLRTAKAKETRRRYRQNRLYERRAGSKVYRAIKNGILKREPCIICEEPNSQAHHLNYRKLLNVIWLCREHHRAYHAGKLRYAV